MRRSCAICSATSSLSPTAPVVAPPRTVKSSPCTTTGRPRWRPRPIRFDGVKSTSHAVLVVASAARQRADLDERARIDQVLDALAPAGGRPLSRWRLSFSSPPIFFAGGVAGGESVDFLLPGHPAPPRYSMTMLAALDEFARLPRTSRLTPRRTFGSSISTSPRPIQLRLRPARRPPCGSPRAGAPPPMAIGVCAGSGMHQPERGVEARRTGLGQGRHVRSSSRQRVGVDTASALSLPALTCAGGRVEHRIDLARQHRSVVAKRADLWGRQHLHAGLAAEKLHGELHQVAPPRRAVRRGGPACLRHLDQVGHVVDRSAQVLVGMHGG